MNRQIKLSISEQIATINLNRPEKLNAFSDAMLLSLIDAVDECESSDKVDVIILTGCGRGFCSGGDINEMGAEAADSPLNAEHYITEIIQAFPKRLMQLEKPIIAAINGVAAGGGLDFALACDFRVASETATFAETYARIGLLPGAGGSWLLPKIVGEGMAMEMLLSGTFIDAKEALRIGLINHLWSDKSLMNNTFQLAKNIATNPRYSVKTIKRLVRQNTTESFSSNLESVAAHIAIAKNSKDYLKAINAIKKSINRPKNR